MSTSMGIDHITLCVENLDAAEYLFTKILGFEVIWSARDVGSEKSSMDTIVVQRGEAKVALMQGRDKVVKSQITEFIEKYGQGVQHVAIEVDDIEAVSREWESHGVQFSGPLKEGRDGFGPLKQRFTYPLFPGGGVFRAHATPARERAVQDLCAWNRGGALQGYRKGSNQRCRAQHHRLRDPAEESPEPQQARLVNYKMWGGARCI